MLKICILKPTTRKNKNIKILSKLFLSTFIYSTRHHTLFLYKPTVTLIKQGVINL